MTQLSSSTALTPVAERVIRVRVWPDAIGGSPQDVVVPWGATIRQIVDAIELKPEHEPRRRHFAAYLGEHLIPRDRWHLVRPAAYAERCPVVLTIRLPAHSRRWRGGGGGRKMLSIVAAIALIGLSVFTAGGGLGFISGALGAGTWGANAAAAAISVAGSLALQGLMRSGGGGAGDQDSQDALGYAGAANNFQPGAQLQRVVGTMRFAPQMAMPPFTTINNGETRDDGSYRYSQFVTMLFALAGRHQVEEIFVNGVEVGTLQDIEYEVREGTPADAPLTLVTDTRIEDETNIEMSEWDVDPEDTDEGAVAIFGTVAEAEPIFHAVQSRPDADGFRVEFLLPEGLVYTSPNPGEGSPYAPMAVAIRGRFRARYLGAWQGWVNLPELIIRAKEPNDALRLHLEVRWVDEYPAEAGSAWPPAAKAFEQIKGWAKVASNGVWQSPLLSIGGDGFAEWHYESEKRVVLYLLKSKYPKARYQFEFKRSWGIYWNNLDPGSGILSSVIGAATDFFSPIESGGVMQIPWNPRNVQDKVVITSVQSIFDEAPIADDGEAVTLVAIRAKNRQISKVELVASGVLEDWDPAAGTWVAERTTSNPAAWYRHVLRDSHNAEPVADALIDTPALQDWHAWCRKWGKSVNGVVQGKSVLETLQLIALAGWASPVFAAEYSVVVDRPRGDPVGMITQRNAGGFGFQMAFADRPHALRVTFLDRDEEYRGREILVYADGYSEANATRFEAISYEGITNEVEAIARATLDLRWMAHRGKLHSFTMDIEHLEFRRGDLVLMETDILGQTLGRGRVRSVETAGGLVSAFVMDEAIDLTGAIGGNGERVTLEDDERETVDADDRVTVAEPVGAALRLADGTIVFHEITIDDLDGTRMVFSSPFAMPVGGGEDLIGAGTLVAVGPLGVEAREVLVWDIAPGPDLTAEITCIDYAETAMYARFFRPFSSGFSAGFFKG